MHLSAQQIIKWTAKGIGSWNVATNWDCNCIPTSNDTVVIEHDTVIIQNGIARAKLLKIKTMGTDTAGLVIFQPATLVVKPELLIAQNDTGIQIVNAFLTNNGQVFIEECRVGLYAAPSTTQIQINGSIRIRNSRKGIVNYGRFENTLAAEIECKNMSGSLQQDASIENFHTFSNDGSIYIHDVLTMGIINRHEGTSFVNNGEIEVDTSGRSIELLDSSNFTNHGTMHLINAQGAIRVVKDATFQNNNLVFGERLSGNAVGCFSNGAATNSDTMVFRNLTDDGIRIGGSFFNTSNAYLHVADVQGNANAIYIIAEDTLTNLGEIKIDSVDTESGLLIGPGAMLENDGSLEINISQTGILSQDGCIENKGDITITETALGISISTALLRNFLNANLSCLNGINGILIVDGASFVNEGNTATAMMMGTPFEVEANSTFENTGTMDVQN